MQLQAKKKGPNDQEVVVICINKITNPWCIYSSRENLFLSIHLSTYENQIQKLMTITVTSYTSHVLVEVHIHYTLKDRCNTKYTPVVLQSLKTNRSPGFMDN